MWMIEFMTKRKNALVVVKMVFFYFFPKKDYFCKNNQAIQLMIKRILYQIFLLLIIFFSLTVIGKFLYSETLLQQNERMLAEIQTVNPTSFARFDKFIQDIETHTKWRVYVTSSFRTAEEQAELRQDDPRNARSGKSKHNLGRAIDLNLYPAQQVWKGWLRKSSPKKSWEQSGVIEIAHKHGLKWGGHFKTYYDPVHFEIP
jgi:hypothetical protein